MSQPEDKSDRAVRRVVAFMPRMVAPHREPEVLDCDNPRRIRIHAVEQYCECCHCGESSVEQPLRALDAELEVDEEVYPRNSAICEECWDYWCAPAEFYADGACFAVCLDPSAADEFNEDIPF